MAGPGCRVHGPGSRTRQPGPLPSPAAECFVYEPWRNPGLGNSATRLKVFNILKAFKRVAELPSPGFLQGSYTKHSAAGLGNGPGCRVRLPGPWTRQPGPAIDASSHCPLLHWNMMTCLNEWCAEYVNRLMQNGPVDRDGRNVSENIRGSRSQS